MLRTIARARWTNVRLQHTGARTVPRRFFRSRSLSTSDANTTVSSVAPLSPTAHSTPSSVASSSSTSRGEQIMSPLYDLPVRSNLPEYTWEEVYTHCTPESYWIVLDSHVYDVTRYAARHPGGGIESTFSRGHGTDVGKEFHELHSWKEKRVTASCLIGRIKPGSVTNRVAKPRPVTSLELEDEPLTEWTETEMTPNSTSHEQSKPTESSTSSTTDPSTKSITEAREKVKKVLIEANKSQKTFSAY